MGNTSTRVVKELETIVPADVPTIPFKGEVIPCRVVDVYDGDTCTIIFMVRKKTPFKINLRMNDIDAPEKRGSSELEKQCAEAVADYVKGLIMGKILPVRIDSWDKYGGRVRGDLFLAQDAVLSVSEHLLQRAMVRPYDGGKRAVWAPEELNAILERCKSIH